MSEDNEDILNELAKDLQDNPPCKSQSTQITQSPMTDISKEEDLEKYINDNTQKNNDVLFQVIKQFAQDVGDDPEKAQAFATLLKSNTELLKLLNDRLIKEKEMKTKIEIQKLKESGDSMEKLIDSQKSVIMNRDKIFKEILNGNSQKKENDDS